MRVNEKGISGIDNDDMPENAKRMLTVVYRMVQGVPGIEVDRSDVIAEAIRLGVLRMTQDEFNEFHRQSVAQFSKRNYN